MPKLIANLRENIPAEARRLLSERGYSGLSLRELADRCGVAVGTLYNYYPSKAALIARLMLEDWQQLLQSVRGNGSDPAPEQLLDAIHDRLAEFVDRNHAIFEDPEAAVSFLQARRIHHPQLLQQLAALLEPVCADPFTRTFLAGSLLSAATDGADWPLLRALLLRLL